MRTIVSSLSLNHRGVRVYAGKVVRDGDVYLMTANVAGFGVKDVRSYVAPVKGVKVGPLWKMTMEKIIDDAIADAPVGTYLLLAGMKRYMQDDLTLPEGVEWVGYEPDARNGKAISTLFIPADLGMVMVEKMAKAAAKVVDADQRGNRATVHLMTTSAHEANEVALLHDLRHVLAARAGEAAAEVAATQKDVDKMQAAVARLTEALATGDRDAAMLALNNVRRAERAVREVLA